MKFLAYFFSMCFLHKMKSGLCNRIQPIRALPRVSAHNVRSSGRLCLSDVKHFPLRSASVLWPGYIRVNLARVDLENLSN